MTRAFATAAGAASDPAGVPSSTWLLVGLLLASVALVASLRVVPERSRLVVSRLGQVTRVAGPGLVLRVPGLEHVTEVSLHPTRVDLVTPAVTLDGVRVRVHAEALVQVTHPALTTWRADSAGPTAAATDEVESALARDVANRELAQLLPQRSQLGRTVAMESTAVTKAWGVEVLRVTVVDLEASLTAELVHGLGQAPDALRQIATEPP